MSDFIFEFFDLREVVAIIAVLLIIKIVMDIRNRQEARREINNRFDRLHRHLDAIDNRLERESKAQGRRIIRVGDRAETIESVVTAPFRDDD